MFGSEISFGVQSLIGNNFYKYMVVVYIVFLFTFVLLQAIGSAYLIRTNDSRGQFLAVTDFSTSGFLSLQTMMDQVLLSINVVVQ